jgi:hypothetical protein
MRFNTAQMCHLTGMRREQLRHWRKTLPPMTGRDGRSDLYELREILALAAMVALADGVGVPAAKLVGCADELFAFFHDADLQQLPRQLYVGADGTVQTVPPRDAQVYSTVVPENVMASVRERLAPEQREQLLLPL